MVNLRDYRRDQHNSPVPKPQRKYAQPRLLLLNSVPLGHLEAELEMPSQLSYENSPKCGSLASAPSSSSVQGLRVVPHAYMSASKRCGEYILNNSVQESAHAGEEGGLHSTKKKTTAAECRQSIQQPPANHQAILTPTNKNGAPLRTPAVLKLRAEVGV